VPLIKPRTRGKQFVRLVTRLKRETNETLYAYAHFLSAPAEYVLNQLLGTVLAKDNGVCRVARRALAVCDPTSAAHAETRRRLRCDANGATREEPSVIHGGHVTMACEPCGNARAGAHRGGG
jgi:hypothetical protein